MNLKYVSIVVIVVACIAVAIVLVNKPESITPVQSSESELRYLPLGDSYTIGESVREDGRWPNQLANGYQPGGKQLRIIANPAVTGYTSQNLIDRELPLLDSLEPDFVSIQIGVNDYVQGIPASTFEKNLTYIISQIQSKIADPKNIVLVTIPDYAKTPSGASYGDPVKATAAIANLNRIITEQAIKNSMPLADIFPVSQQVTSDPSLVANDGLHPSAKQYTLWTNIIIETLKGKQ